MRLGSFTASAALALALILLIAGCETRSISNAGYPGDRPNPFYRGELSEFDLLGIDAGTAPTEADIGKQFVPHTRLVLRRGAPIVVIQSGAIMPDDAMLRELDRYFATTPFSGVPPRAEAAYRPGIAAEPAASYARVLRLAAAKGGYETILCYWGILESAKANQGTKLVSWVPVVGAAVPDEVQQMRIRLRVALVDVKTGAWTMFAPEPSEDAALSAAFNRRQSDQEQVVLLKERAYKGAVGAVVARFAE
jgi:hypothetical protein